MTPKNEHAMKVCLSISHDDGRLQVLDIECDFFSLISGDLGPLQAHPSGKEGLPVAAYYFGSTDDAAISTLLQGMIASATDLSPEITANTMTQMATGLWPSRRVLKNSRR